MCGKVLCRVGLWDLGKIRKEVFGDNIRGI